MSCADCGPARTALLRAGRYFADRECSFGEGAYDAEGGLQGGFAYLVFEGALDFVEGANYADCGFAALGFQGEVIGSCVLRIDLALDEAFGF